MSGPRVDVSAIVPVRNASHLLAQSLISLQSQAYRKCEAIVVDQGSTDDTPEVVERFTVADDRIRALRIPSALASCPRNAGASRARHGWLLFLDAGDDLLMRDHLGPAPAAFACPYSDHDRVVQQMVGACGYLFGLSAIPARTRLSDPMLSLPRIEVAAGDSLRDFVLKLHTDDASHGAL